MTYSQTTNTTVTMSMDEDRFEEFKALLKAEIKEEMKEEDDEKDEKWKKKVEDDILQKYQQDKEQNQQELQQIKDRQNQQDAEIEWVNKDVTKFKDEKEKLENETATLKTNVTEYG